MLDKDSIDSLYIMTVATSRQVLPTNNIVLGTSMASLLHVHGALAIICDTTRFSVT